MTLRRMCVIGADVAIVAAANEIAFRLRFDGATPVWAQAVQWQALPVLLLMRAVLFAPFGLYRGMWRYAGLWELRKIVIAVGLSTGVFFMFTAVAGIAQYPRSVMLIDALVTMALMGGARLAVRVARAASFAGPRTVRSGKPRRSVLIFGAGEAGDSIVREIRDKGLDDYVPVGFVDDDPAKVGQSIHGVPVLGTRRDAAPHHRDAPTPTRC